MLGHNVVFTMAVMPTKYFERCCCPACRFKLDTVSVGTKNCPQCNEVLDPQHVWQTRTYPGVIQLPGWVSAFGWPVLLILMAITWAAFGYVATSGRSFVVPGGLLVLGIVWFLIKLGGYDR